ncbi:MAG: hypothetical protein B6D59_00195 [Campylobacteraceae bacterium 4484_4]|nr:MAG: hypothetical protein B6D59_00195 [Campylobacteraceae bacterium 4484_4]
MHRLKLCFTLFLSLLFLGCAGYNPFKPGPGDIIYSSGPSTLPVQSPNRSRLMYKATMRPYTVCGVTYYPKAARVGEKFRGKASWYGNDFHGCKTSNGEYYDMYTRTAAHKTLPINTVVRVTNLRNRKSTTVRINDRGPFVKDRIIDLSYQAAQDIDMIRTGTAPVEIEVLSLDTTANRYAPKAPPILRDSAPVVWKTAPDRSVSTKRKGGKWAVQIDVFTDPVKAKLRAKRYKNLPSPLHTALKTVKFHNSRLYKVIITGFADKESAQNYIRTHQLKGAFVLRNR